MKLKLSINRMRDALLMTTVDTCQRLDKASESIPDSSQASEDNASNGKNRTDGDKKKV
jgi:hypothetical protein